MLVYRNNNIFLPFLCKLSEQKYFEARKALVLRLSWLRKASVTDVVLIPFRDLKALKNTYTSKRKRPVEWLADDTTTHFEKWLPAWLSRWCSGHYARLASGETWVRFLLGITCFSFHVRCVRKLYHTMLDCEIFIYLSEQIFFCFVHQHVGNATTHFAFVRHLSLHCY